MRTGSRTIGRVARRLLELALVLLAATSASAEPIKYALVNATFNDGGTATGYVVLDDPGAPALPTVTDWAITVSGGALGILKFSYDPYSSTVEVFNSIIVFHGVWWSGPPCGGQPRQLQIGLLNLDGGIETCSVQRSFATGSFQQVPGPLITVKANNQHPADRTIIGGGFVRFSLDVSPAGSTADLDWYFAIVWEQNLYWVTSAGVSSTPTPIRHGPAAPVNNQTLFFFGIGNSTASAWVFAADGSSIVAIDHMTAVTVPSP